MREDSKRITTCELADGTIDVCADMRWCGRDGLNEVHLRVAPDLTITSTPTYLSNLSFVGRARCKPGRRFAGFRNTDNPLSWYAGSEPALVHGRPKPGSLQREVWRVAYVKHRMRVEATRRVWNGLLRRALEYVDPFVLALAKKVDTTTYFYNAIVADRRLEALVEESRALGVLVAGAPAGRVQTSDLATAFKQLGVADVSESFLYYATHQHFTPRFTPGMGRSGRAVLVHRAAEMLRTVPVEWMHKLHGAEQWAFLNLLLARDRNRADEMLWCYLSTDPAAVLAYVDALAPQRGVGGRTQARFGALASIGISSRPTPIPDFDRMRNVHRVTAQLAGTPADDYALQF